MKVGHVFVFMNRDVPEAHATINVPGLGEVKIINALSTRLCEEIQAEAVAALRLSLGQVIKTETAATQAHANAGVGIEAISQAGSKPASSAVPDSA